MPSKNETKKDKINLGMHHTLIYQSNIYMVLLRYIIIEKHNSNPNCI